jgi:serine/threonine protein kinase
VNRPLVMIVEEPQGGAKWTYILKRSPVVLGRDAETCDIAFARPSVSKVQAEIAFDDGKVTYRDLDSRNGSIVDGEPIPADVAVKVLETSDIVVGGRLRLTFSRDDSARGSEGINPFDPPRIRSSLVFEPTAVHVGSIPARPQVQPPAVVRPPVSAAPVPLYPMPDPGEQPMMTERMPVPEPAPPETPPTPDDQLHEAETPVPLNPGDIVAHYRVESLIGRGGMGTVYKVSHVRASAKRFAMKVLSSEVVGHPEAESRFLREAEAASRVEHPHVVSMIDFGRDRGISYLVLELLVGEDLSALIARRKLSIERTADIMLAVCAGVSAAHQLGIIHRDLKPGNIFLSRNDMGDTVPKVLDFGISKLRMPGDTKLTQRFSLIGTPNHLSPEQAEGRPVDARCDVYALGTILYECVTGRQCHEGESLYEILRSIAEADYPRPKSLRPDLSAEFEAVIMKALAKNPNNRFQTVHELGCALVPHGSLKRRQIWKDFYMKSTGDPLESSSFTAAPISLSKYEVPQQPRTELLPQGEAPGIPKSPFRREPQPPAPVSPSESSRRRRAAGAHDSERREERPTAAEPEGIRRWVLPVILGGLIGVVALLLVMKAVRRPSVDAVPTPQPMTQPQLEPSNTVTMPALAESPKQTLPAPTPPKAAIETPPPAAVPPVAAPQPKTKPAVASPRRRASTESSRQDRAGRAQDESPVRQVPRNRSGVPLLRP